MTPPLNGNALRVWSAQPCLRGDVQKLPEQNLSRNKNCSSSIKSKIVVDARLRGLLRSSLATLKERWFAPTRRGAITVRALAFSRVDLEPSDGNYHAQASGRPRGSKTQVMLLYAWRSLPSGPAKSPTSCPNKQLSVFPAEFSARVLRSATFLCVVFNTRRHDMKLILHRTKKAISRGSRNICIGIGSKWKLRHTCYYLYIRNKITGIQSQVFAKSWNCKACVKNILIPQYLKKLNTIKWDYFVTVTTKTKCAPPVWRINRAKKKFQDFLRSATNRYAPKGGVVYFSSIGLTSTGRIHFHFLWKGAKPSKKWIRKKWHGLTGCYEVDVRPAHDNHKLYLLKNAAQIPDFSLDTRFTFKDQNELHDFRRVTYTHGIFPALPKTKSEWEVMNFSQN